MNQRPEYPSIVSTRPRVPLTRKDLKVIMVGVAISPVLGFLIAVVFRTAHGS